MFTVFDILVLEDSVSKPYSLHPYQLSHLPSSSSVSHAHELGPRLLWLASHRTAQCLSSRSLIPDGNRTLDAARHAECVCDVDPRAEVLCALVRGPAIGIKFASSHLFFYCDLYNAHKKEYLNLSFDIQAIRFELLFFKLKTL